MKSSEILSTAKENGINLNRSNAAKFIKAFLNNRRENFGACRWISDADGKDIIRTTRVQGRGMNVKNVCHLHDMNVYLQQLGIEYRQGNDATKGGQAGNYIRIITDIEFDV